MGPRLAVTVGDPRGIGPELIAKAIAADVIPRDRLVLVGPTGAGLDVDVPVGTWAAASSAADAGYLAGRAVDAAVDLALAGDVAGLVTAPLDKAALHAGGYDVPGHTELLAQRTGCDTAMMLAATGPRPGERGTLRVVLATTHVALRDVPARLTADVLARTAAITRTGLTEGFGIDDPRIALCALNPHAGDGGRFGREDDELLRPLARELRLAGPFPADTVFVRALRDEFDAVIAPYHDVGMTAIKVAAFGRAVNVTLGLPFPRTSPDHGTALDIAGRGIADPSSFFEALRLCDTLAHRAAPVTIS
ncbi:4-hydroxythreonine-4-phosphate dehydrogenase [Gemmatimonadetes bacterium T265]|nr:4-hydroxythreonine-4-phosphate dehydrogenase [Gemmatimonadetes bacterium T265]